MIPYLYIFDVPKDKELFLELLKLLEANKDITDSSIYSFINSDDTTGIQYSIRNEDYGFVHNDEYKEWNKKVSYDEIIANIHCLEKITHWGLESKKGNIK